MNKKEINEMKMVVKEATGYNLNQIDIISFTDTEIDYNIYKNYENDSRLGKVPIDIGTVKKNKEDNKMYRILKQNEGYIIFKSESESEINFEDIDVKDIPFEEYQEAEDYSQYGYNYDETVFILEKKKARLRHDDTKGFCLVDFLTGDYIAAAEVGDIEDDIDWEKVEQQAKKLGYELEQSDI